MAAPGTSASHSRRPAGSPRPTVPTATPPHPGPRASARGGAGSARTGASPIGWRSGRARQVADWTEPPGSRSPVGGRARPVRGRRRLPLAGK